MLPSDLKIDHNHDNMSSSPNVRFDCQQLNSNEHENYLGSINLE